MAAGSNSVIDRRASVAAAEVARLTASRGAGESRRPGPSGAICLCCPIGDKPYALARWLAAFAALRLPEGVDVDLLWLDLRGGIRGTDGTDGTDRLAQAFALEAPRFRTARLITAAQAGKRRPMLIARNQRNPAARYRSMAETFQILSDLARAQSAETAERAGGPLHTSPDTDSAAGVPAPESASRLPRRVTAAEQTNLWSAQAPDICILEDDILPEPDGLVRLWQGFCSDAAITLLAAAQPDREPGVARILAWRWEKVRVFGDADSCREMQLRGRMPGYRDARADGVEPIDGVATGFCLVRASFLKDYRWRATATWAQDVCLCSDIAKAGGTVAIHWGVRVAHVSQSPFGSGEHTATIYRNPGPYRPALRRTARTWPDRVALISCSYGQANRLVVDAHRRSLLYWRAQKRPFNLYFAELVFNGESSAYADELRHDADQHLVLHGGEQHRWLMQKEALLNVAAKRALADGCGILVFLDADAWTPDREWLDKVARRLAPTEPENWNVALQAWREFRDTHPAIDRPAARRFSLAYAKLAGGNERAANHDGSPGLCWAFTAPYFEAIGGLNPWGISGSGDNLLVWELCDPEHRREAGCTFAYFDDVRREGLPRGRLDWTDSFFWHEHHGWFKDRAYGFSRRVIDLFRPLEQIVGLDAAGLLAWKGETPLRHILADKPAIATPDGYRRTLAKWGLKCNL